MFIGTPTPAPGSEPGAIAPLAIARGLSFIELMEILEFGRLRLEPPGDTHPAGDDAILIGTQDWAVADAQPPATLSSEGPDIFLYSTLQALSEAVLPADHTQLRIDRPRQRTAAGRRTRVRSVRICALSAGRGRRPLNLPAAQPLVRVDVNTLIQRVEVSAHAPGPLFELVQRLVRTRVWVDVVRPL